MTKKVHWIFGQEPGAPPERQSSLLRISTTGRVKYVKLILKVLCTYEAKQLL